MNKSGMLSVDTRGRGFTEVTGEVVGWLRGIGAGEGLLTLFIRHTSASLTIQENADPTVLADLSDALAAMAPEDRRYRHDTEGPDDMPAHIKAMLTAVHLSIPVAGGAALLGTWQGIFVIEHRARPHRRQIALNFIGS
ncbi:MAG TPA: secondary thiamine-phosphate synthase enzyme YjbQ [Hyphomicrobiales bacterium]|nr:secondary thiamine-phosphate synthase enzyme YjbQ [Hyphomicrobiales bacterium]